MNLYKNYWKKDLHPGWDLNPGPNGLQSSQRHAIRHPTSSASAHFIYIPYNKITIHKSGLYDLTRMANSQPLSPGQRNSVYGVLDMHKRWSIWAHYFFLFSWAIPLYAVGDIHMLLGKDSEINYESKTIAQTRNSVEYSTLLEDKESPLVFC